VGPAKRDTLTRRRQLAEAALDLLSREGWEGLRIAALARRVGVVPSAVYRHFRGKEEVLDAMLEHLRWRLDRNVDEARASAPDPVGRLQALLLLQVRTIREIACLPRLVFAGDVWEGKDRRERLQPLIGGFLSRVESLFRDAQRAGLARRDVRAREFAAMFLGLFQPAAVLWHASGGAFDIERQARRAWKVFLDGMRPPRRARAPARGARRRA
jgi:AcrR family transcriptional regulator